MPIIVPPSDELWQGDIFSDALWVSARDLKFVQPAGERRYELCQPTVVGHRGQIVVGGGRSMGILLSHECAIDNHADQPVAVARVLDLSKQSTRMQESIRNSTNKSAFYLPAGGGLVADSYVDFRLMTTLMPAQLGAFHKIASLDEEMRDAMREMLVRYWTRTEP